MCEETRPKHHGSSCDQNETGITNQASMIQANEGMSSEISRNKDSRDEASTIPKPELGKFDRKSTTVKHPKGKPIPELWIYESQQELETTNGDTTDDADWELEWHKVLRGERTTCKERSAHRRRVKYKRDRKSDDPIIVERFRVKTEKQRIRAQELAKKAKENVDKTLSENEEDEATKEAREAKEAKQIEKRRKRQRESYHAKKKAKQNSDKTLSENEEDDAAKEKEAEKVEKRRKRQRKRYHEKNDPLVQARRQARVLNKEKEQELRDANILAEIPAPFLSEFSIQISEDSKELEDQGRKEAELAAIALANASASFLVFDTELSLLENESFLENIPPQFLSVFPGQPSEQEKGRDEDQETEAAELSAFVLFNASTCLLNFDKNLTPREVPAHYLSEIQFQVSNDEDQEREAAGLSAVALENASIFLSVFDAESMFLRIERDLASIPQNFLSEFPGRLFEESEGSEKDQIQEIEAAELSTTVLTTVSSLFRDFNSEFIPLDIPEQFLSEFPGRLFEETEGSDTEQIQEVEAAKLSALVLTTASSLFLDFDLDLIPLDIPEHFLSEFPSQSCENPEGQTKDQIREIQEIRASEATKLSAAVLANASNLFLNFDEQLVLVEDESLLKSKFLLQIPVVESVSLADIIFPSTHGNTTRIEGEVDLIVISRCSGQWIIGGYAQMMLGNMIVAQKFEADFLYPIVVGRQESVSWHDTKAGKPLPSVHPATAFSPLLPDDDSNKHCDARYVEFFENSRNFSTILMLIRGLDGASIDKGSYLFLEAMHPTLNIWLAFSVQPNYTQNQPAFVEIPVNPNWFLRTNPFDEKIYIFFQLTRLNLVIRNQLRDQKYEWLSARDANRIAIAQTTGTEQGETIGHFFAENPSSRPGGDIKIPTPSEACQK